ncbi:MAG: THUMP domain-containing protein [Thermofilaceae archaeon]
MLKKFNLLASTYRRRENDLLSELWYFLRDLGDIEVKASPTGLPGLVVLYTKLDPFKVVEEVASRINSEPWYFRFLLKIEPIEVCTQVDLEEIKREALNLAAKKLNLNDRYRIEARIRLSALTRDEVISAIAPNIPNKVDLEHPDKIVLVEVIRDVAGIAIVEPKHIVSVQRLRRAARAETEGEG